MRKAAFVLIGLGIIVVVAGQIYVSWQPEPVPPVAANATTLRSTEGGNVVGFIDKYGARSWQGIPFAQPPVGALRWRAPQPPSPTASTLQALKPGALCPQFASLLSGAGEQAPRGRLPATKTACT